MSRSSSSLNGLDININKYNHSTQTNIIQGNGTAASNNCSIEASLSRINDVKKEKMMGAFVTIYMVIVISIFFYLFDGHGRFYHLVAFFLLNLLIVFVGYFIYVIWHINSLHYILILRKPLDNFNTDSLFIPYKIFEDKSKPITSISHLFALRGSNFEKISTIVLSMVFGMIFAAVTNKWTHHNNVKHKTELIILMSSGLCCIFLVYWDISTETIHSKSTDIIHYIIAVFTLILPPIAFVLNQNGSILSITLFGLVLTLAIIWFVVLDKIFQINNETTPTQPISKSKVHRISLIYLVTELSAVTIMNVCIILFVYCMEKDEILWL